MPALVCAGPCRTAGPDHHPVSVRETSLGTAAAVRVGHHPEQSGAPERIGVRDDEKLLAARRASIRTGMHGAEPSSIQRAVHLDDLGRRERAGDKTLKTSSYEPFRVAEQRPAWAAARGARASHSGGRQGRTIERLVDLRPPRDLKASEGRGDSL
jgi:hypothetical protein